MGRIIINYAKDVDVKDAMLTVYEVIKMGRISKDEKAYCLATSFKDGTVVVADLTKNGTDVFNVSKMEKHRKG